MKKTVVFLLALFLLVACSKKGEIRPPYNPEEYLKKAAKLIDREEYDEARSLLFEVKNRDFTGKYAPLAQLKIAESYEKEDEPDRAIAEYRRFLQLYPEHPQAPYAQYQIAMIYYRQIQSPDTGAGGARKAIEEFEKLLRKYPRNPFREAAKIRIKKCRDILADYEFYVGKFYFKKGSYQAALGRFQEILKKYKDYSSLPEVLYYTARTYKRLGDNEKFRFYLNEIIKRFPKSKYAKKAKKALSLK